MSYWISVEGYRWWPIYVDTAQLAVANGDARYHHRDGLKVYYTWVRARP